MTQPSYAVDFRGLPACPCQVAWIPELEIELRRRGIIQGNLGIAQMIGLYEASGNTHGNPDGEGLRKGGGETDFWLTGSTAEKAVAVMREMGADPTWHRGPNWDHDGGSEHVHCGQRACPHRTVEALAQEWAVDHNGDGLVGDAPDPGPRPLSGRTWREGIAWAHQQQEEDMAQYDDQLDQIQADAAGAKAAAEHAVEVLLEERRKDRVRMTRVMGRLARVIALSKETATKTELQAAVDELTADD